ncbi:MAG: MliC family protein [Alphaproteobacteria bacterium]|nr:MliC family protein [Alphaproteobacteria bacterium]
MKKVFLFAVICFALAACDAKNASDVIVQQCGDYTVEITLSESGDRINAVLNGDAAELINAVSASGARFDGVLNDTPVTMWNKGDSWTMILDEDMVYECVAK